jgi:DNA-binding NarL/FixJ family response regulator
LGGALVDHPHEPGAETALVVDELPLVRAGIGATLETRGVEVWAQTRSGREAVSLATVDPVSLVVCGVPADLPIADLVRRLVKVPARPVIVVLLPPAHDDLVAYLLALGVQGVALRAGDTEELGVAVDAALKGVQFVVPGLHAALSGHVKLRPLADAGPEVLSSREREVLVLLAEGRTNREIAAALSVTLATVKSHLVKIYAKLEASNRNEALGRGVALGLLG